MSRNEVGRIVASAVLSLIARHAGASLIWDGDASKGTSIFGNLNCGSPGTVTAVSDATQGTVWRYNKPSADSRCESHGIRVNGSSYVYSEGGTYYFGWRNKLTSLADNNANFQWKSYGTFTQNYPILMKMIGGRQTLQYRAPGENCCRTLWSTPLSTNTWNHQVVAIHYSTDASTGWISLWWNGVQQTLSGGVTRYAARTHDGDNDPKWGVYGAESTAVTNYVDGLRLGTTAADVLPGGATATPTPGPTPTPGATPTATPTPTGTGTSFEAENVSYANSGTGATLQTDANASGGKWVSLDAENTGSWLEFTTPTISAGTYSLRMRYKTNDNRGQLTMKVDGTQVGGTLDQYQSSSTYPTVTFGTVSFGSAASHKLRLTVVGKNGSSSSYVLSADQFILQ
jgi:hypothetical protein